MGSWPTILGKVTGSLPEGEATPKSRSTRAGPAMVPGWNAKSTASTWSRILPSVRGRPAMITRIVGLPVPATAAMSSSWAPGRSMFARLWASPVMIASSPRKSTTASDCSAAATAAAKPPVSRLLEVSSPLA